MIFLCTNIDNIISGPQRTEEMGKNAVFDPFNIFRFYSKLSYGVVL